MSLLVWVPCLIGMFLLLSALDQYLFVPIYAAITEGTSLGKLLEGWTGNCWSGHLRNDCGFNLQLSYAAAILVFPLWAAFFLCFSTVLTISSQTNELTGAKKRSVYGILSLLILGTFIYFYTSTFQLISIDGIVVVFVAGLVALSVLVNLLAEILKKAPISRSYNLRRFFEIAFARSCIPVIACLLLGVIPILDDFIYSSALVETTTKGWFASFGALSGIVGGVASSLYGYYSLAKRASPSLAAIVFSTIGAFIFVYILLMIAYALNVLSL